MPKILNSNCNLHCLERCKQISSLANIIFFIFFWKYKILRLICKQFWFWPGRSIAQDKSSKKRLLPVATSILPPLDLASCQFPPPQNAVNQDSLLLSSHICQRPPLSKKKNVWMIINSFKTHSYKQSWHENIASGCTSQNAITKIKMLT